ncbi:MAG: hypothetical protein IKO63_01745 [Paludibacteraceae bacterium]|nr:hypothetical protein [Paludibacteraceae bacterium]
MKSIKFLSIAAVAALFTACNYDVKPESLYMNEDQVKEKIADGKLYTINEFLDAFMTEEGNYLSDTSMYRTRATNGDGIYLFSIDTLPTTGPGIYIRGRVSTDDFGGNFYKALVIQQIVDGKQQNLRLSIDMGSASGMYPRGQELLIRCNGLAIGRYSNQPQLCVPSYNNNTNAQHGEQKVGWAPGRIPAPICKQHFMLVGTPDESKLQYDEVTIAQCVANYSDIVGARKIDGRLVILKNVWFDGKYNDQSNGPSLCVHYNPETGVGNPEVADSNADVFAPTTNNVGYPQSRCITDGSQWTLVSTSEYAKYAHYYLPYEKVGDAIVYGTYKGSVRGILGYYMDNAGYAPDQAK